MYTSRANRSRNGERGGKQEHVSSDKPIVKGLSDTRVDEATRLDTHLFPELSVIDPPVQEEVMGPKLGDEPVLMHETDEEVPILTQSAVVAQLTPLLAAQEQSMKMMTEIIGVVTQLVQTQTT